MPRKPSPALPAFTAVPRKCARHDGWTPERQRLFIETLADYGSVRAAANAVGMTPESAYYLRRQPGAESFRAAWQAALDLGVQRIEDVAMERALNGIDVPVYSYGKLVGKRTVYNDRLLMFMLRNRAPERFAEGGAKGMNAADKSTLARLKKEWRAEWEREQELLENDRERDTLASLSAKFDKMRERQAAAESPRTRAAREEYERLRAEDEALGFEWWISAEHAVGAEDGDCEHTGGPSEAMKKLLPGYRKPVEEDVGPRVRTVKDEGW